LPKQQGTNTSTTNGTTKPPPELPLKGPPQKETTPQLQTTPLGATVVVTRVVGNRRRLHRRREQNPHNNIQLYHTHYEGWVAGETGLQGGAEDQQLLITPPPVTLYF
jgi:hypothetical protein